MPLVIGTDGLTYADGTTQVDGFDSASDRGKLLSINSWDAPGTYTWTRPANCKKILVKVVGGGGGAAGFCESGGAGGYAERVIDVTSISTATVTIGAGGSGVGYYAAAPDGGTSSFGVHVSASGGRGANTQFAHTGGRGGVGSNGSINLNGGDGTGHTNSVGHYPGGTGGGSYFGGSATVNRDTTSSRTDRGAPGSGGPGGRTNDGHSGNTGDPGIIVVYNFQ